MSMEIANYKKQLQKFGKTEIIGGTNNSKKSFFSLFNSYFKKTTFILQSISLSFCYSEFQANNIDVLIEFLKKIERCESLLLELSNTNLRSNNIQSIVDQLSCITHVQSLRLGLGYIKIDQDTILSVFNLLQTYNKLTEISLFLYFLHIGNRGINHLSQNLIKQANSLNILNLRLEANNITDEGVQSLAQSIQKLNQLQNIGIGLSGNQITEKGYDTLINAIFSCSESLQKMYLSVNVEKCKDENYQFQHFSERHSNLKHLSIIQSKSTMRHFLKIKLSQIEELNLQFTSVTISEGGFDDISEFISKCSSSDKLKTLSLELNCLIPDSAMLQLTNSVSACHSLENFTFKLVQHEQDSKFLMNIDNFSKTKLKSLDLYLNQQYSNNSIATISETLLSQKNLTKLSLKIIQNFLLIKSHEELSPILETFKHMDQLQEITLQISNFFLSGESGEFIGQSLSACKYLKSIELTLNNNQLDEVEIHKLINQLARVQSLERLKLQLIDNQLNCQHYSSITEGLSLMHSLNYLFLIFNSNQYLEKSTQVLGIVKNVQNLQKLTYLQINVYDVDLENEQQIRNSLSKIRSLVRYCIIT